jgi:hypothetical protein
MINKNRKSRNGILLCRFILYLSEAYILRVGNVDWELRVRDSFGSIL